MSHLLVWYHIVPFKLASLCIQLDLYIFILHHILHIQFVLFFIKAIQLHNETNNKVGLSKILSGWQQNA